jgi:hypothetical protein
VLGQVEDEVGISEHGIDTTEADLVPVVEQHGTESPCTIRLPAGLPAFN